MGIWNKTTDGSVEIPMGNITEAARSLDDRMLTEAVAELKTAGQFTEMSNSSSAAAQLIEAVSRLRLMQFERKVKHYQESGDPAEVERLRHEISRKLFGRRCRKSNGFWLATRQRSERSCKGSRPLRPGVGYT